MISWLKKLFVPHAENDHRPHFWRDKSVGVLLALVLLAELVVLVQSYVVFNTGSYLAAVLPGVVAALTNDQRVDNNAAPLTENSVLTEAATLKANDMAAKGYFSHNTPEGYLPWYWLDKVGYSYTHAGENLAVNFTDSKDVVDAWMNSPTHRANIVKQVYTETGVAMAQGVYEGKEAIFVVQFFGTPQTATSVATPAVVAAAVATTSPTSLTTPAKTAVPSTKVAVATKPITVTPPSSASSSSNVVASSSAAASSTPTASSTSIAGVSPSSGLNPGSEVAGAELDKASSSAAASVGSNAHIADSNFITSFVASPRHGGAYIFFILLGIIFAAALISLVMGKTVHHPRIILLTAAFILIITGLLTLNDRILKDNVIVGEGDTITHTL